MIGSAVIELLLARGASVRTVIHIRPPPVELRGKNIEIVRGDLTRWETCIKAVKGVDCIFHLATFVGGLGMTTAHPAGVFTPNVLMNTQMLEAARLEGVERYLYESCGCIYPDMDVFLEERAWNGPPPKANASFAWAKRLGELQAQAYHEEYAMKIAITRPANSYGPNDNFDLETCHVIPAFIRKAVERHDPFVIWGSGEMMRDFIYSKDVAQGMLLTLEKYPVADPVNLATGNAIKIKALADLILRLTGFQHPRVLYDVSKPSGQIKRVFSTDKAKKKVGFVAQTTLEEGLRKTVGWYRKRYRLEVKKNNPNLNPYGKPITPKDPVNPGEEPHQP